jgi:DNA-binding NarL/FixJ family response regulator
MPPTIPADAADAAPVKRRVLIVDDHRFFGACLRAALDSESDLAVCDITASSAELTARIDRLRPDLLIIDLSLGAESGLDLGRRLRALEITTPILFISTLGQPTRAALEAVRHSAFAAKTQKPAEFLTALRSMLAPPASPPRRPAARIGFAAMSKA